MIKGAPKMKDNVLTEIAKILGDAFTNTIIDECLKQLRLSANGAPSTKWRKLLFVFRKYQDKNKSSKDVFRILESLLAPVRFIKDTQTYNAILTEINKVICTEGYEIDDTGTVIVANKLSTLDEINARYSSLIKKLQDRNIHSQVLKYCTAELLTENYFHSVFEAAKGISERVREMSGIDLDGTQLYNAVFSVSNPILKYNDLVSDSEKNQQNGLKEMLNGITHYVRNVTAHEPKIKWIIEEDAAIEILTVISFLHSALDKCIRVK